ncbi:hypothetical protein ACP70R_003113 [Stipagrostis hirtigluma subsp. patula]
MPGSKTGSTSILETEQGTHVLEIVGYSQQRGIGVDKSILSGGFSVGGHTWHIVFYPDGISSDEGDLVTVGLVLLSKNIKVRASFELRLINQTTGSPVPWYNLAPRVFSGDNTMTISTRSKAEEEAAEMKTNLQAVQQDIAEMKKKWDEMDEMKSMLKTLFLSNQKREIEEGKVKIASITTLPDGSGPSTVDGSKEDEIEHSGSATDSRLPGVVTTLVPDRVMPDKIVTDTGASKAISVQ